jgi:hypothetical protein
MRIPGRAGPFPVAAGPHAREDRPGQKEEFMTTMTAALRPAIRHLGGLILLFASLGAAAADLARFDNFKDRQGIPMELKQVAPDLWFLYDDLSSNAAFLVTDEGVLVIDTRQHPQHGRELIKMIRKVTDKSRGIRLGNYVQIRAVEDEELEQVWSGKKSAKEALDAIVKRGNEHLERFEKANKS